MILKSLSKRDISSKLNSAWGRKYNKKNYSFYFHTSNLQINIQLCVDEWILCCPHHIQVLFFYVLSFIFFLICFMLLCFQSATNPKIHNEYVYLTQCFNYRAIVCNVMQWILLTNSKMMRRNYVHSGYYDCSKLLTKWL